MDIFQILRKGELPSIHNIHIKAVNVIVIIHLYIY